MARRRKQTHDPRQLSLFDAMVHHIEQIRKENIQDDMREEARSASSPRDEQRPASVIPASDQQNIQEDRQTRPSRGWFELLGDSPKTMRPLGLNGRGETVYEMENGVRMYSRNPEFMQTVDGDGSTPEELFLQNNHNFLTIQEVAAFRQQHSPSLERQHAGQADKPAGHRKNRTQAGNNRGSKDGGFPNSAYLILDRWALNSPEELKKLEAMGDIPFMVKLYGQQQKEAEALSSETSRQASLRGMSDSEILESMGIDMSLKITG